jgi:hypothetical protein
MIVITLIILILPGKTQAWNKAGHMVTGAIAYRELKAADPTALKRVIAIFKEHPFYEERWKPAIAALETNDPDKEGLFLLMNAARWPDDIRGDPELHCEECHFINFRFDPNKPNNNPPFPQDDDVVSAFADNLAVAVSGAPDDEKAAALSWVFHLIGDVHQPLHTAALVKPPMFPASRRGDRGGTRFFIRARPNAQTIHLHRFWDGLVIGSERFNSVNNRATALRAAFPRSGMDELSERRFTRWANTESLRIAKRDAYRNGNLQGSTDRDNGAVLPTDYADAVQPIAERRAVLAGYRIADILKDNF